MALNGLFPISRRFLTVFARLQHKIKESDHKNLQNCKFSAQFKFGFVLCKHSLKSNLASSMCTKSIFCEIEIIF